MDPYDEHSLTEEVVYLHSLWHQGPPIQKHQLHRPPLHLHPSTSTSLHDLSMSNPSQINRKRSNKSRGREYKKKLKIPRQPEESVTKELPVYPTSISSPASNSGWPTPLLKSDSKTLLLSALQQARLAACRAQVQALNATIDFLSSDYADEDDDDDLEDIDDSEELVTKEWPVNPPSLSSPASNSGWPTPLSENDSKTLLLSPQQQARLAASRAQVKALNATIDFLSSDDSDDEDLEGIDDDLDSMEEKYGFFVNLFTEDCGLKEYYLKNYSKGEFNCLVCGWTLKKYKNCAALVQHSNSISKKRRVHRAYGRAICNFLGWEIDKLPQIISDISAKANESLNKSSVCMPEAEAPKVVVKNDAGISVKTAGIAKIASAAAKVDNNAISSKNTAAPKPGKAAYGQKLKSKFSNLINEVDTNTEQDNLQQQKEAGIGAEGKQANSGIAAVVAGANFVDSRSRTPYAQAAIVTTNSFDHTSSEKVGTTGCWADETEQEEEGVPTPNAKADDNGKTERKKSDAMNNEPSIDLKSTEQHQEENTKDEGKLLGAHDGIKEATKPHQDKKQLQTVPKPGGKKTQVETYLMWDEDHKDFICKYTRKKRTTRNHKQKVIIDV